MISSDLNEVIEECDRVLTMYKGRVTGEFVARSVALGIRARSDRRGPSAMLDADLGFAPDHSAQACGSVADASDRRRAARSHVSRACVALGLISDARDLLRAGAKNLSLLLRQGSRSPQLRRQACRSSLSWARSTSRSAVRFIFAALSRRRFRRTSWIGDVADRTDHRACGRPGWRHGRASGSSRHAIPSFVVTLSGRRTSRHRLLRERRANDSADFQILQFPERGLHPADGVVCRVGPRLRDRIDFTGFRRIENSADGEARSRSPFGSPFSWRRVRLPGLDLRRLPRHSLGDALGRGDWDCSHHPHGPDEIRAQYLTSSGPTERPRC